MTPASITLLALAGCCLKLNRLKLALQHNPIFMVLLALITGIALSHIFTVSHISPEDIATSLVWLAVPLFAFLYHQRITQLLPWFMTLLWLLNTWQLITEWNKWPSGITGNSNWSAALIIVSTPFGLWVIWEKIGKNIKTLPYRKFALIAGLIIIISALLLYKLFSKGANLALLAATVITLLVYFVDFNKRSNKILLLVGGVIVAFGMLFILKSNAFVAFTAHDVRLPLWSGALHLIIDHPLNGVSPVAFESTFAPYVPVDYYLRGAIAAARNNHPHSHLLYFAASFGIIATIAWGWLIIRPLIEQFNQRRTADTMRMIYLFTLLVLLLHGMVDLTLFSWPCGYIFLIILGLLWHDCWGVKLKAKTTTTPWLISGFILGGLLLGCSVYVAYLNADSSYYNRQALIVLKHGQPQKALQYCKRSLAYKTTPQSLYRAAIIALFDLKEPKLALSYLKKFDQTPDENYLSNNGLRARALCVLHQPTQALPFFARETKNYPIGSLNWYFFYYTLRMLHLKKAADVAHENLIYSLKVKGMTPNDIPLLIKHPELDIQFLEDDGKTPKINKFRLQ